TPPFATPLQYTKFLPFLQVRVLVFGRFALYLQVGVIKAFFVIFTITSVFGVDGFCRRLLHALFNVGETTMYVIDKKAAVPHQPAHTLKYSDFV
ncbi:MAG: hypothetical protein FWC89_10520, partial [Defluviitaleaceae bacterium]|nr:hypothetical protein [Defluviitaleaceae bacterium]